MTRVVPRIRAGLLGTLAAVCSGAPALADDTEVFSNQIAAQSIRPNVLFIIDTSGSMNAGVNVPRAPYESTLSYSGPCTSSRIYVTRATQGGGTPATPPSCTGPAVVSIPESRNRCRALAEALESPAGLWTGRAVQWDPAGAIWAELRAGVDDEPIECEADAGLHGEDDVDPQRWARNGDDDQRWTSDRNEAISWGATTAYAFYSANYLNWVASAPAPAVVSRLRIVQAVSTQLAYSLDRINLGLMRFSNNELGGEQEAEGGMVTAAVAPIEGNRAALAQQINGFTADGFTPLSETLYEAQQYFAGRAVDYGLDSRIDFDTPLPSVSDSRRANDPDLYQSPIDAQCQRNYVVLLTDGEPTRDNSADSRITALPGFATANGDADCTGGDGPGRCLSDVAAYMRNADLSPLPGRQYVTTYTIGFGPEVEGSTLLRRVAERGGGRAYDANNIEQLTGVLQSIFAEIVQGGSTFVSPSVSINAFNRTQTTNDLYVSLFSPAATERWLGNLKKYRIEGGQLLDARGQPAVDPATGFFEPNARSLWSTTDDGANVSQGGAASRLPAPSARRVYTWLASSGTRDLTAAANALVVSNAGLTDALLGTSLGVEPTRDQVIEWARGVDVNDANGNGDRTETLRTLGDPLHASPALVSYGGSTATRDALDLVAFLPTNDGFLHAVNTRTGEELWAFVPPELLGRLQALYRNGTVAQRSYGLDSEVRVLKFDVNQDGIVDAAAGDRVFIYFGMRRGGRFYYALDVTNRNVPRLMWTLGPSQLPGVGETWSPPTLARVRVGGAVQNGENLVLIFGGGYDDAQQNYQYTTDNSGHRIFMVDAQTGSLLWYAGGPRGAGSPDLPLADMTHSVPARVVVLDTNGDAFADRLYASDMGGRLWRFDITNGNSRSQLVAGGVLAELGAARAAGTQAGGIADTRRFYNAPDVALIQRRGARPYYNLAIGSGYRGHPLHTETDDRFYAVRDYNPFGRLTQAQYNDPSRPRVRESNLIDVTSDPGRVPVPADAAGWRLQLEAHGQGEKVLNDSITVNGAVLFTSYQPAPPQDACGAPLGINRVYAIRVDNGAAVVDFNDDQVVDRRDLSVQLRQTGIAGGVAVLTESTSGDSGSSAPPTDPLGNRQICTVGVEVLQRCVAVGSVVRTFWQRTADNGTD